MRPVTIIQDKGNGFLLVCVRQGSIITRTSLNARIYEREAAVAEAQALYPGREVQVYLPGADK